MRVRAEEVMYDGEFKHASIGEEPKKHQICEVFVPELKTSLFGIVKSFGTNQILDVEILHIDIHEVHQLRKLNQYFMKWDKTHKLLEVRLCPLIRPIFEASHPVKKQDLCVFFVPGIGAFDVFVHEEFDKECEIQFVDTSADKTVKKACQSLGDKFFKKSATQGRFLVKREFLRKTDVTDNQPFYSRDGSSKNENDVETVDVTAESYDLEQKKSVVTSNGNRENILLEYVNKLCSIDENYMLKYCSKKEHYGTVFDVICEGSNLICGIELIKCCDCQIVCDGKFKGKRYTESKPGKCLFVDSSALEIIPFSVCEINQARHGGVCEIFVPMTDRKVPMTERPENLRRNLGNAYPEFPYSSDTQQLSYNSHSKQCSTGAYPKTSPNSVYTKTAHNHMGDNSSHNQHGYGKHHQDFQSNSSLLNKNNAMAPYPSITSRLPSLPCFESSDKNWRIKIGDFCSVDKGYMAALCKNKGHYGFVFMVYPSSTKHSEREKPPIVGLKLINSCECATVGDGTYRGQMMLENPCPDRCLFPSLKKVNLIEFEKSTIPDFNIDDICQVYIPSIEQHCYGFIRNVDKKVLEVQLLDSTCQYIEGFDGVNIKYQQNYVDGPNVLVKIFQNFAKSLFRCSPVTNGDICQLFVPGQDKFQ